MDACSDGEESEPRDGRRECVMGLWGEDPGWSRLAPEPDERRGWCAWYGKVASRRKIVRPWPRLTLRGELNGEPSSKETSILSLRKPLWRNGVAKPSSSSLVTDCASGLVGGWYAKVDEKEEDKGEAVDLKLPAESAKGIRWSKLNEGMDGRGGDVDIQVMSTERRSWRCREGGLGRPPCMLPCR